MNQEIVKLLWKRLKVELKLWRDRRHSVYTKVTTAADRRRILEYAVVPKRRRSTNLTLRPLSGDGWTQTQALCHPEAMLWPRKEAKIGNQRRNRNPSSQQNRRAAHFEHIQANSISTPTGAETGEAEREKRIGYWGGSSQMGLLCSWFIRFWRFEILTNYTNAYH